MNAHTIARIQRELMEIAATDSQRSRLDDWFHRFVTEFEVARPVGDEGVRSAKVEEREVIVELYRRLGEELWDKEAGFQVFEKGQGGLTRKIRVFVLTT